MENNTDLTASHRRCVERQHGLVIAFNISLIPFIAFTGPSRTLVACWMWQELCK
jgi:hypothetical protein